MVSHDLRAPLLNIRGFSQELARSLHAIDPCFQKHLPLLDPADRETVAPLLQKDIPEALQFIGSSVMKMDGLISAILRISRAGRRRLNLEPVRVDVLVREAVDTQAHQIASRNISVTIGEMPELVSDRAALEQIFSNLLDNAIKYLEPGRPGVIAVTAERSDGLVLFRVSDNGRGIAGRGHSPRLRDVPEGGQAGCPRRRHRARLRKNARAPPGRPYLVPFRTRHRIHIQLFAPPPPHRSSAS